MHASTTHLKKIFRMSRISALTLCLLFCFALPALSLDTDVYQTNIKPNVAILFDTSGSMEFGVYDSTINYGYFYNYRSEQGDYDLVAYGGGGTNNYYYAENGPGTSPQYPTNEILLIMGTDKNGIGVTITNDGVSYTGDAGDPDYLWSPSTIVHTYTFIDADGNLSGDGTHTQRLTTDADGHILLDGSRLPIDRDILLHDWQYNPDGSKIDKGFGGQVNAPGWYFSGFEGVNATAHNIVENGDSYIYFFITGNWINMQMMYNLYTINSKDEDYRTWKTTTLPDASETNWKTVPYEAQSTNYPLDYPNYNSQTWKITQPDAVKIRIHFTDFNTESGYDYVKFYKEDTSSSNYLGRISGDLGTDYWTTSYTLANDNHDLIITFNSDYSVVKKGFIIDKYQYLEGSEVETGYKMQRRIDVVRDAMLYVVDETQGKINWALASFNNGNGATILQPFTNDQSEETIRANLVEALDGLEPEGGTPLGEALQDIFKHFAGKEDILPECSRNYCITISDGFPSADGDWSRISAKTFTDEDNDNWTEDPYQYTTPPEDYFDDVASYLYHISFRDRTEIDEPETSYDNVTCHMLSFIQGLPLLEDAAMDGGGIYLAAYNKQQLVNAFYSLGLMIIKSTSYVAPVISVDTSNKTQSGDKLYMAFFKPTVDRWSGNLKKYQLVKKPKDNCSTRSKEEWVVTDKNGVDAVDCEGTFLETSVSFWSTESDGGEVERGGVGAIMKAAIADSNMTSSPYTSTGRHIYILKNDGTKVQLLPDNISNDDLGVSDDAERFKIINYIYGYTFAEDGSDAHYPVARRNWPLGSFIHSTPTIIHYEAEDPAEIYVVIGGNDGMLHVFDDSDGSEVIAFIPENLLPRLKELNPDERADFPSPLFFVDGATTYKYDFNDEGQIEPEQIIFGERRGGRAYYSIDVSDPDPANWTKKWYIDNSLEGFDELGQSWSKVVLVKFSDSSSTTKTMGVFCGGYDNSGTDRNDPDEDGGYDTKGRAIFFIDVDKNESEAGFLLKSVTYSTDSSDPAYLMNFAIPCEPLILTNDYGYFSGVYLADLGGQVWHIDYNYTDYSWGNPRLVFSANPGSNNDSGSTGGETLNSTDKNRKMFYAPTATYLGDCNFVDTETDENDDGEPDARDPLTIMLMVGTGDREQPMETDTHNRIYTIVDAPPHGDKLFLDENDLLNVTDDELDVNSTLTPSARETLYDTLSQTYGWYIKLDEISDSYSHAGEKVLSQPLIFYGIGYITTFTPVTTDPCFPHGEAKVYGLNYCDGTSGLNYYQGNDDDGGKKYDYRDRYRTIGEAIPSSPEIIIRDGVVAAFSSVGGGLPGLGEEGTSRIPQPAFAIDMINWRSLRNNK